MKIIERFEIPYYQFLNENSQIADEFPLIAENKQVLPVLYQLMVLVRMLDAKAIALQRTGKLGTYPSTRGQEAVFVGIGHALAKKDVYIPYYRDVGSLLQRGVTFSQILQYWGGDERGNFFNPESEDFPHSVPVGSQPLHAVGVGYAIKYRHQQRAVMVTCGDGATSQGDFYEALNVAGAWQLPVVFVVCNNQWAISVPRAKQSSCETLAQKAIAAGLDCIQVDGNDVIAMMDVMKTALLQVRNGGKAIVIEAVSYRLADHTTVDDASRYSDVEEKKSAWKKEPIARLGYYLEAQGVWNKEKENELQHTTKEFVEKEINHYFSREKQKPETMFDYMYETLPDAYIDQRNDLLENS